jgi:hypothetical protein
MVEGTRFAGPPLTDFGINILMGGFGQSNLSGGQSEFGLDGHIFVYKDSGFDALLIGLEQSAPMLHSRAELPSIDDNTVGLSGTHSVTGASDDYTSAGSLYFSNLIYKLKLFETCKKLTPIKYNGMCVKITDANIDLVMRLFNEFSTSNEAELRQFLNRTPQRTEEKIFKEIDFITQIKAAEIDALFTQLKTVYALSEKDVKTQQLFKTQMETIKRLSASLDSIEYAHLTPIDVDNPHLQRLKNIVDNGLKAIHQEYLDKVNTLISVTEERDANQIALVYATYDKHGVHTPAANALRDAFRSYRTCQLALQEYQSKEQKVFARGLTLCSELNHSARNMRLVLETEETQMIWLLSNERDAFKGLLATQEAPIVITAPASFLMNLSQEIFNLRNLGLLSAAAAVGLLASVFIPHVSLTVIFGLALGAAFVSLFCFFKTTADITSNCEPKGLPRP